MKTFRFDDISINSSGLNDGNIAALIHSKFPTAKIIFGVSPLVHHQCGERVYPEIFNAFSRLTPFMEPDACGIPKIPIGVETAGHGLWHIDHRLLSEDMQEASILTSCALVGAKMFIPPFNKYTKHMIDFCGHMEIELIKFEDGWKSMEYNDYDPDHDLWYLHARHWNIAKIINWFES